VNSLIRIPGCGERRCDNYSLVVSTLLLVRIRKFAQSIHTNKTYAGAAIAGVTEATATKSAMKVLVKCIADIFKQQNHVRQHKK
jgi:hypothetical protein